MSKQQKQPPAVKSPSGLSLKIDPRYLYRAVYTTEEEMREFLTRCDRELEVNSRVFRRRLPDLMKEHEGEFVLMRNGEMLGFFSDKKKAYAEGNKLFNDCIFNAMKVEDVVYDLGVLSRI